MLQVLLLVSASACGGRRACVTVKCFLACQDARQSFSLKATCWMGASGHGLSGIVTAQHKVGTSLCSVADTGRFTVTGSSP